MTRMTLKQHYSPFQEHLFHYYTKQFVPLWKKKLWNGSYYLIILHYIDAIDLSLGNISCYQSSHYLQLHLLNFFRSAPLHTSWNLCPLGKQAPATFKCTHIILLAKLKFQAEEMTDKKKTGFSVNRVCVPDILDHCLDTEDNL